MKRFAPSALLLSLLVPVLAQAGWLKLPKGLPHHGGPAAKSAAVATAAIASPSEIVGMWRSIKTTNDSGGTVHDTTEIWVGSDNKTELRTSLVATSTDYPDQDFFMKIDAKGTLSIAGGNLINTTTSCQMDGSLLGSGDCVSADPSDTTALADIIIATIDGKKAMITKASSPDETDDTVFYVGASPSFLVQPPVAGVRRTELARLAAHGGLRVIDGSYAAPGTMGLWDLRGRGLSAIHPGMGVFLIRP